MAPCFFATFCRVELVDVCWMPERVFPYTIFLGPFTFDVQVVRQDGHVGAYLRQVANGARPSPTELQVAFQLCVHSASLEIRRTQVAICAFDGFRPWGCPHLCTLDAVRSEQAQGCAVAVTVHAAVASPTSPAAELGDVAPIRLWQAPRPSFQPFWCNGDFTDCTVRMGGTAAVESASQPSPPLSATVFKCHRVVLAAASPVFSKMFNSSMKEATQQELVIHDTEPAAVELLLLAAYGAPQLLVPLPLLLPLTKLADQYQMPGLLDAATAWFKLTKFSPTALIVLVPQAVALGLADIAELLVEPLAAMVNDERIDTTSLLAYWQLEAVALLLEAARGSFSAFKAALCWSATAAGRVAPGSGSEEGDSEQQQQQQQSATAAPAAVESASAVAVSAAESQARVIQGGGSAAHAHNPEQRHTAWAVHAHQSLVSVDSRTLLEAIALLLEAVSGCFSAFKAALCWLATAAGKEAPGPGGKEGNTEQQQQQQLQQSTTAAPAGVELASAAAVSATKPEACVIQGEGSAAHANTSEQRHVAPTSQAALAHQSLASFDSTTAWALLLPLVRFKGGFTAEQLMAARTLPGADGIPGPETRLLEAYEELHKTAAGLASSNG